MRFLTLFAPLTVRYSSRGVRHARWPGSCVTVSVYASAVRVPKFALPIRLPDLPVGEAVWLDPQRLGRSGDPLWRHASRTTSPPPQDRFRRSDPHDRPCSESDTAGAHTCLRAWETRQAVRVMDCAARTEAQCR